MWDPLHILSEEGHPNNHAEPVAGGPGVEELAEVPPRVIIPIQLHLGLNLFNLELHNRCVGIALRVVFGEDSNSLVLTVVGDEPSGRLREKQDKDHGDGREEALDHGRETPGPAVVETQVATICRPS